MSGKGVRPGRKRLADKERKNEKKGEEGNGTILDEKINSPTTPMLLVVFRGAFENVTLVENLPK